MFPRLYHTSSVVHSLSKQGYRLTKMLNPKTKRSWYQPQNTMPTAISLSKTDKEPGKRSLRRISMLNKLFMKNITDLMSTGSLSLEVLGHGIEISKVKMTPNFQTLNVYWVCKGSSDDIATEALLNRVAGMLRHELSTLRVMGEVPYIGFVKDTQVSQTVVLDNYLTTADYGEDYSPTGIGHMIKSEFTLNTKLSPEMKAKIKQMEDSENTEDDPIPEMTHTVYGLDHDKITNRLLAARKLSQDAWNKLDSPENIVTYRAPEVKMIPNDVVKDDKQLADFLQKRKILQDKLHKDAYSRKPESEVYKQLQETESENCDDDYYFDDEFEFEEDDTENSENKSSDHYL